VNAIVTIEGRRVADVQPFDSSFADNMFRKRATSGSRKLRNAILKLQGIAPPIELPAPSEREEIEVPQYCCPTCHSPLYRKRQLISEIQRSVADFYNITVPMLVSADCRREVAWPRQRAMYLAAELTAQSIAEIGRRFNRDHTTVLHAIKAVRKRCETDDQEAFDITLLRERLAA
jgi:hypothetical protein